MRRPLSPQLDTLLSRPSRSLRSLRPLISSPRFPLLTSSLAPPGPLAPLRTNRAAALRQTSSHAHTHCTDSAMQADEASALMRLAVVERQLIMQGLNLRSLARLASTCSQLRAEAMHPEAGRFTSDSQVIQPGQAFVINWRHPAHASPLFRKHAPMTLSCDASSSPHIEGLLRAAALFSRATTLDASGFAMSEQHVWTESQMLRLLSLPCMQHVETVEQLRSMWLQSPRVQTALFSLPQLQHCQIFVDSTTKLLPTAGALASKLVGLSVVVDSEYNVASLRSLRALRLAPALATLEFSFGFDSVFDNVDDWPPPIGPVLIALVWCLPPTLRRLNVWGPPVPRDMTRPLAKTLFSRTPLLQSLQISGSIKPILRGLLDAGPRMLPMLRQLRFCDVTPFNFPFDENPDPIPPLLRRFLHQFPEVTVRLNIFNSLWGDPEQLSAMLVRYLRWPRVELYSMDTEGPIGEPPSPHSSDDEKGSDVECLSDPGSDGESEEDDEGADEDEEELSEDEEEHDDGGDEAD